MMKMREFFTEINRKKVNYLYLLPYAVLFFTFTVLPVIMSIGLSFTQYNVLQPAVFTGVDNYIKLMFEDDIFTTALINTLVMAVATGPIGYIISFILAWMINDLGKMPRQLLVLLIYAPTISGNLYMVWKIIFSDDANGFLNSFLMYLGITDENIYWLTDTNFMMGVVIFVTLWMSMGAGFLSFVAGLQGVDNSQLEAGSIDGIRNRWQELWFIILPSMKPQLLFGAVMSITNAFSIGDVTTALCGMPSTDYGVHTIINHLVDYGSTRFDMGYASAIATVLFAMMVICNRLFQKLLQRVGQ